MAHDGMPEPRLCTGRPPGSNCTFRESRAAFPAVGRASGGGNPLLCCRPQPKRLSSCSDGRACQAGLLPLTVIRLRLMQFERYSGSEQKISGNPEQFPEPLNLPT